MSCDAGRVSVVYAEPVNPHDPSCGCMNWGHYDENGEPCHHTSICAAHELAEELRKARPAHAI